MEAVCLKVLLRQFSRAEVFLIFFFRKWESTENNKQKEEKGKDF